MDKQYTFVGVLLLVAAFGLMIWSSMDQQKKQAAWLKDHPQAAQTAAGNATAVQAPTASALSAAPVTGATPTATNGQTATATGTLAPLAAAAAKPVTPAKTYVLENDSIAVTLTSDGGAIRDVALKKFKQHVDKPEPVIFNEDASTPALGLAIGSAVKPGVPPVPLALSYSVDDGARTPTSLTFHYRGDDGVDITRSYSISTSGNEGDPYIITHRTTFNNTGAKPVSLDQLFVNAGTAPPTPGSDVYALMYLDFGYYDGSSVGFVAGSLFRDTPARYFGLLAARPKQNEFVYDPRTNLPALQWVAVKDQFFVAVLTTTSGALSSGYYVQGVPAKLDGNDETTVTGDLEMNLGQLKPGMKKTLDFSYYVGPKEYVRLDQLGEKQSLLMEFGWFRIFSQVLLLALVAIHSALVHISPVWAWGWAIVAFTVIMKLAIWPLTAIQVRSAKRMGEIQKPLAAIREKYKDKPEKIQTETMKIFRENKVNPAAGCMPLLIQIPIFLGFNSMLRTASELRFASFLWIPNLSAPDTIAHILGFSINILPLLYCATSMMQMRMMPSPTTDDTQRKIMQFMPLWMLFFFYTMPSGMVLYFTCSNLLTMLQQYLIKSRRDAAFATADTQSFSGKSK